MSSRGLRALGLALLAAGGGWIVLWGLWLAAQHRAGQLDAAAAILGLLLFAFLPAAAAWAGGAVILLRAGRLAREEAEAALETRIAEAVRTRGIVRLTPLARELGLPEPALRRAVERLVGLELLPGTIDWERGELMAPYARLGEACPRCGGQLEPAGKGLLACRYCGSRFPVESAEPGEDG
ncbi:MAG TPA: hypothetical protein ENK19_10865 [Acidobacteria bacterium]|nr:hypothetical protein [Acidobacteriota bacterium]